SRWRGEKQNSHSRKAFSYPGEIHLSTTPPAPGRQPTILAVAIAMTYPTVIAWVYFLALGGKGEPSALQQAVYLGNKVVQFSLPVLFFALVVRSWPRLPPARAREILPGLGV